MLNREVREAIEKEQFHIWPVSKVEEAFELLTGFHAGHWDEKRSRFEEGSAFDKIYKMLHQKSDEKKAKEKNSAKKKTIKKTKIAKRNCCEKYFET